MEWRISMSVSFDRAQALLTDKSPSYSLGDVELVLGVEFSPEQRIALDSENIPFSEEILRACAGTHKLFPGLPMSLLGIRQCYPDLFYVRSGGWWADEKVAQKALRPSWYLLRMPASRQYSFTIRPTVSRQSGNGRIDRRSGENRRNNAPSRSSRMPAASR